MQAQITKKNILHLPLDNKQLAGYSEYMLNNTTNDKQTVAKFATGMRAASLVDALRAAGIVAVATQPKWTNKRFPPPRIAVTVASADFDRAGAVLAEFNAKR